MSSNLIKQPYEMVLDPTGGGGRAKPVANGKFYVGEMDKDPVANPRTDIAYKDESGQERPLTSPLTLNNSGAFVVSENDGTIIQPYMKDAVGFSVLITDSRGRDVYSSLNTGDPGNIKPALDLYFPELIPKYTDIVYKASGGNSPVENMVIGNPVSIDIGETCQCENGTIFKKVSDTNNSPSDFLPLSSVKIIDFGAPTDGSSDLGPTLNLINDSYSGSIEIDFDNSFDYTIDTPVKFSFSGGWKINGNKSKVFVSDAIETGIEIDNIDDSFGIISELWLRGKEQTSPNVKLIQLTGANSNTTIIDGCKFQFARRCVALSNTYIIKITDSDFNNSKTAIYSNSTDDLKVSGCTFGTSFILENVIYAAGSGSVSINNNSFETESSGYSLRLSGSTNRGCWFSDNNLTNSGGVYADTTVIVSGNYFYSSKSDVLSDAVVRINAGARNSVVTNNVITPTNGTGWAIKTYSERSTISNNTIRFYEFGILSAGDACTISGNAVENCSNTGLKLTGYLSNASSNIILVSGSYDVDISEATDPLLVSNTFDSIKDLLVKSEFLTARRTPRVTYGTSEPNTGTWGRGDVVYNKSPSVGQYIGWTCTAPGTPGTWNGFGKIEA